MEATSRPRVADPEFDLSPIPPVRLRDFDPAEHQRLVVNPFLAVVVLVFSWVCSGWMVLAVAPILPRLAQYHCLDCGQTGSYRDHRHHACPIVLDRWREGRRPWFPSAWSQMVAWCWVLGAVGVLLFIVLTVG